MSGKVMQDEPVDRCLPCQAKGIHRDTLTDVMLVSLRNVTYNAAATRGGQIARLSPSDD